MLIENSTDLKEQSRIPNIVSTKVKKAPAFLLAAEGALIRKIDNQHG